MRKEEYEAQRWGYDIERNQARARKILRELEKEVDDKEQSIYVSKEVAMGLGLQLILDASNGAHLESAGEMLRQTFTSEHRTIQQLATRVFQFFFTAVAKWTDGKRNQDLRNEAAMEQIAEWATDMKYLPYI